MLPPVTRLAAAPFRPVRFEPGGETRSKTGPGHGARLVCRLGQGVRITFPA